MTQAFTLRVRKYARRFAWNRGLEAAVRWIPGASAIGAALWFSSLLVPGISAWIVLPAFLTPVLTAALVTRHSSRAAEDALRWLDRRIAGHQELQAAWEFQGGPFAAVAARRALAVLDAAGSPPPVPSASPMRALWAAVAPGLLLLMLLGGFGTPGGSGGDYSPVFGDAFDEFIRNARPRENREFTRREPGAGTAAEPGAAPGARSVPDETIQSRRNDLVRDDLAEQSVDDLGIDTESAESFLVRRGYESFGAPLRLTERLAEAFSQGFSELFSGADSQGGAADSNFRSADARGGDAPGGPGDSRASEDAAGSEDSRNSDAPEDPRASGAGEGPEGAGAQSDTPGGEENDAQPGNRESSGAGGLDEGDTGGSKTGRGRGSGRAEDTGGEQTPLQRRIGKEPLNLSSPLESESRGSGGMRTVIRAYGEEEYEGADSRDVPLRGEWRAEVESVIHREDIPLSTRVFVRDYFLALEE